MNSAAASTPAPAEGYTLCIEILGSGIQSVPTTVVVENWQSVTGVTNDVLNVASATSVG